MGENLSDTAARILLNKIVESMRTGQDRGKGDVVAHLFCLNEEGQLTAIPITQGDFFIFGEEVVNSEVHARITTHD